jgi:hypothetical protein
MVNVVPPVVIMPEMPAAMVALACVMDPIVLFEILETVLAASRYMPEEIPPEFVTIVIIELVLFTSMIFTGCCSILAFPAVK